MARLSRLAAAVFFLAIASLVWGDTAPTANSSSDAQSAAPAWHGADGQALLSGTFSGLSSDGKQAHIQKPDNSTTDIQLDTLSVADRAFALLHAKGDSEFQRTYRQWTSANGKFHVDAKVISADQQNAKLIRNDGKLVNVPLDKLSKDDQSYLDRLKEAITSAARDKENPFEVIDSPFASVAAFNGQKSTAGQTKHQDTARRKVPASETKLPGTADDPTVYVTKTGTKYHTAGCRYLSKSSIPMPLSQAAARYSPCSVCNPPVLGNSFSESQQDKSSINPSSRTQSASPPASSSYIDRNPNNETVTGHTATGIPTYTGPRGGHYHYSKSGNKVYERKK